MIRNLDAPLRNLDGTPIRQERSPESVSVDGSGDPREPPVLTVKEVVTHALLAAKDGDKPNGEDSARRYKLALRLFDGGEQDVKSDELVLIKKLVGQLYGPLVVGQVYEWCDPDVKAKSPAKGRP